VPTEDEPVGPAINWNDVGIPVVLFLVLASVGPLLGAELRSQPAELRLAVLTLALYCVPMALIYFLRDRPLRFGLCVGALLLATSAGNILVASDGKVRNIVHEERSFFGVLRVVDVVDAEDDDRVLRRFVHGSTLHGL